jgi:hypothetical protein
MLTDPRPPSVGDAVTFVRRMLGPRMILSVAFMAMAIVCVVAATTLGGRGPSRAGSATHTHGIPASYVRCRHWPARSTIGYLGPTRSTVPAIQADLSICT